MKFSRNTKVLPEALVVTNAYNSIQNNTSITVHPTREKMAWPQAIKNQKDNTYFFTFIVTAAANLLP